MNRTKYTVLAKRKHKTTNIIINEEIERIVIWTISGTIIIAGSEEREKLIVESNMDVKRLRLQLGFQIFDVLQLLVF